MSKIELTESQIHEVFVNTLVSEKELIKRHLKDVHNDNYLPLYSNNKEEECLLIKKDLKAIKRILSIYGK